MRMTPSEAAIFALVLGFTSGVLLLAGLVVRPEHHSESSAGEQEPGAAGSTDASPAERRPGESGPHFEVRVRDVSGAPISGATVRLASSNGRGSMASLDRHTDERGESSFPSLTQSEYELRVTKSGFATLKRKVAITATGSARPDHVDVVLRGGDRKLTGHVVDVSATPVGGLHILARALDVENATTLTYEAISSREGSFALQEVPDLAYDLTVAPGQGELRLAHAVSARPDGGDVLLRLTGRAGGASAARGGTQVTGRVRGAGGNALADVEIEFTSLTQAGSSRGQTALTSTEGTFSIANVAPGSYRLIVTKVEYATASLTVEVGAVAEQPLAPIELRRGGQITVTITDQGGRPLPSIPVRVIGSEPNYNLVYRTAQDGTVRATGLPEGKYLIKVAMASGSSREVFLHDGERAAVSLAQ